MKTLIFLPGFGDLFFNLSEMLSHTIRDIGYMGDIIIFSTHDFESKFADVINVDKHKDANLLITGKKYMFHRKIPNQVEENYNIYKEKYDYFMIKTLPGDFIDKEYYDKIMYLDSDILVNKSLNEIFEIDNIAIEYHGWNTLKCFNKSNRWYDAKESSSFLNKKLIDRGKILIGDGGPGFCIPRKYYDFFDDYRRNYLKFLHLTKHDAPSLAYTYMENERYNPTVLKRRKYWMHYWGGCSGKIQMINDYKNRFNK